MTKINYFSENHQIDDVQWKDKYVYVYFSEKGCTKPGEHQFFKIELPVFYQWLEDNGHLEIETPKPSLNGSDDWENDTYTASVMPEEFHLLENSYTEPIIKEYLLIAYPKRNEWDDVSDAINDITKNSKYGSSN